MLLWFSVQCKSLSNFAYELKRESPYIPAVFMRHLLKKALSPVICQPYLRGIYSQNPQVREIRIKRDSRRYAPAVFTWNFLKKSVSPRKFLGKRLVFSLASENIVMFTCLELFLSKFKVSNEQIQA